MAAGRFFTSAVASDVMGLLRDASESLRTFTDAVNRGFRAMSDASESFGFVSNAVSSAGKRLIGDTAMGFAQETINARANGQPFEPGGAFAYSAGRALSEAPLVGDVFARDFNSAKAAEDRVGAVYAMLGRAGAEPDRDAIRRQLQFLYAQEDRAAQARTVVRSVAEEPNGIYIQALDRGTQRLGGVVGLSEVPAAVSPYDNARKVGTSPR